MKRQSLRSLLALGVTISVLIASFGCGQPSVTDHVRSGDALLDDAANRYSIEEIDRDGVRAALEHYKKAKNLEPTNLEVMLKVADCHLLLGEQAQAKQVLSEAKRAHPDSPLVRVHERKMSE